MASHTFVLLLTLFSLSLFAQDTQILENGTNTPLTGASIQLTDDLQIEKQPFLAPSLLKSGNELITILLPNHAIYHVRVYDAMGKKYLDQKGNCDESRISWETQDLTPQQYIVILETYRLDGQQGVQRAGFIVEQ